MLQHHKLKLTCDSRLQLGISILLKNSSKSLVELVETYRKSKNLRTPATITPTFWGYPFLHHGIQWEEKASVKKDLAGITSSYQKFEIEPIPCYAVLHSKRNEFQVGLNFHHEKFVDMKLAFGQWGGESCCKEYVLRSHSDDQSRCSTFCHFLTIKTENEAEANDAIQELGDLIRKYGSVFTVDSLLLHGYWTNTNSIKNYYSTLAAFRLRPPKDQILAQLTKLRKLAFEDEVYGNQKQRKRSSYRSVTDVNQLQLRDVMRIKKHQYVKRLGQKATETVFHSGLLRMIKSGRYIPRGVSYRVIDFSIPMEKKYKKSCKVKRLILGVKSNTLQFESLHMKDQPDMSKSIAVQEIRYKSLPHSVLSIEKASYMPPRCTRKEAQQLEMKRLNRPLVRRIKTALLVNYKYLTFDVS